MHYPYDDWTQSAPKLLLGQIVHFEGKRHGGDAVADILAPRWPNDQLRILSFAKKPSRWENASPGRARAGGPELKDLSKPGQPGGQRHDGADDRAPRPALSAGLGVVVHDAGSSGGHRVRRGPLSRVAAPHRKAMHGVLCVFG